MRKTPMVGLGLLILIAINTSLSQASGFNQEIGIKINEAYCWKVKRSIDREKTWIDQYFIGHYITAIQNTKNNQTQIFGLLLSSTQAGFWENVHEEDQLAQVSARPTIPQILQSSYLPNMTQVHTYQDILNQEVKELYSEDSNVTTWESNPFQIEINLKYGNGTETRVWIRYDYNGVKRHQTTEIRTSNDTGEIGFEFIDIFAYTPKQMVSMEDLVNLDEIDSTILRFRNNFSITEGFILLSVIGLDCFPQRDIKNF